MGSWFKGGTYFKIKNGDQPTSLIIGRNTFALIHVSMIRVCNKVKTKASILQQYLLCLVVYQKIATKYQWCKKMLILM